MSGSPVLLDRSALRVNQGTIVVLLVIAFVGSWPILVAAIAAVLALGSVLGRPGFLPLYALVLRPLGWVHPERVRDGAAPHRFAQALGAAMLAASSVALFANQPLLGWALAWVVVALAALDLASGVCVGCLVHEALARREGRGAGRRGG